MSGPRCLFGFGSPFDDPFSSVGVSLDNSSQTRGPNLLAVGVIYGPNLSDRSCLIPLVLGTDSGSKVLLENVDAGKGRFETVRVMFGVKLDTTNMGRDAGTGSDTGTGSVLGA